MRFSLRWMLTGVAILAAALAIWANRAHQQQRAVAEIRRLGGDVGYASPVLPLVQQIVGNDFVANVDTVRLVRHGPGFYENGLVTDYESLVACLYRFPRLKEVVLMDFNHREWGPELDKLFPNVKFVIRHGGII